MGAEARIGSLAGGDVDKRGAGPPWPEEVDPPVLPVPVVDPPVLPVPVVDPPVLPVPVVDPPVLPVFSDWASAVGESAPTKRRADAVIACVLREGSGQSTVRT
jgi:hypothetical protein